MEYILLIGGLILLVISGTYLVESAVDIAKKFKLPSLIIGMTIVAFGTSTPELMVSIQAAIGGHPEIALGNVVGSNIANIGLILGLTALILPIRVNKQSIKVDWPFLMISSVLFVIVAWGGNFNRIEGIIAFLALIIFTSWSIMKSKKEHKGKDTFEPPKKSLLFNIFLFIATCVGVSYGADFMVEGASVIAIKLGLSERVISILIVGVGTSLPELAASLIAAIKKEDEISLGNIIGSNIFNILSVLGITSIIRPIHFSDSGFHSDFIWMIVFTFLLFIGMLNITGNLKKVKETKSLRLLFDGENGLLDRKWGAAILILYIIYIVNQFI